MSTATSRKLNKKGLLTRLGETIDCYTAEHRTAKENISACPPKPLKQRWLPTPGNILFTIVVVVTLIWTQNSGTISLIAAPNIRSASTGTIAYQGRLADAGGSPLTDTVNMTFRLYAAAAGGAPLWEEQWTGANSVQVSDGLFNVMLGSVNSIGQAVITGNGNLFLGITVGTDSEMSPRVQLGSVPFATQALTVPDGSITTEKLAPDIELMPQGAIIMWNGSVATLPTGWQLCDGTAGTPDLRNRFIVGAGSTYSVGNMGGTTEVTLTVDQLPAHAHSYTDKFTDGNRDSGSHAWDATSDKNPRYVSENKSTGAIGGNQPHENRPPFYALAFICKQ